MTDPDNSNQLAFGQFHLDLGKRELRRDGLPVKLRSRAIDILCVLAQAEGKVVTKAELMAEIWSGVIVEDSNIQVHVSNLRKPLDEGTDGEGFIVTVPGRGYRLLGLQSRPQAAGLPGIQPGLSIPETCIAVLPFTSMSGDPEQEYFADDIVEDIITGLSRIQWLSVIARNSRFICKGRPIEIEGMSGYIAREGRRLGDKLLNLGGTTTDAASWSVSARLSNGWINCSRISTRMAAASAWPGDASRSCNNAPRRIAQAVEREAVTLSG